MNTEQNRTSRRPSPRGWRLAVILASVVLVVAGALTGIILASRSGGGPASVPAASPSTGPTTSTTHPTIRQSPTTPTTITTSPTPEPASYLFLWPFHGRDDAAAWQQSYRSGGHQPWHLDGGLTALSFTRDYLGYTNVDKVIGIAPIGPLDLVTVGFDNPAKAPVRSAILDLVRIGDGNDAPWEVVSTGDTTLSVQSPAYGATVRSPVTISGRITGVDESLRIQVRQLGRQEPVGSVGGIPAGGQHAPWTATVPFDESEHGVFTIAVATGGHIAAVERFAITAVIA